MLGAGWIGFDRVRASQVATAQRDRQIEVTTRLTRIHTQLRNAMKADEAKAIVGISLPALHAIVSTLRPADNPAGVVATLEDAFASETWWEPLRREFPVSGLAFGPDRLDAAVGDGARDLEVREILTAAASSGTASGVARGGNQVFSLVAQRWVLPNLPRPAILVLGRPLDARYLAPYLPSAKSSLSIEHNGAVLSRAGAGDSTAGNSPDSGAAWVVARVPFDATTLALAMHAGDLAIEGKAAFPPVAILGAGVFLALLVLVFSIRPSRAAPPPSLDMVPVADLSLPERTRLGLGSGPGIGRPSAPLAMAETQAALPDTGRAYLGTVGRYTLIDKLGEGGMAEVFTAVAFGAEGFQRKFVVKRLRPELLDDKMATSQFIDEAKLGSSLVHSNIIAVFDFGKMGETCYLAMEYILGRDLGKLVQRGLALGKGPLPMPVICLAATETCKALDYAHAKLGEDGQPLDLVHRDISPSNILLSLRGEVKLFDFGIVKAKGRETRTEQGVVKGNVSFMSPEQARGMPTDARSDLFSLGLVLFYCATGRTLYEAESMYERLLQAAAGPTEQHWRIIDTLPAPLPAVLRQALNEKPALRFASAADFAEAFAEARIATSQEAAAVVQRLVGDELADEENRLTNFRSQTSPTPTQAPSPKASTNGAA